MKKKKAGIFSKLTDLQTKKEKTSSHREATEIQSTQARNEYIMSLAATNAHLHQLFSMDVPTLILHLDDDVLSKAQEFMLTLVEKETNALRSLTEGMTKANDLMQSSSHDFTNSAFLSEANTACLR